MEGRCQGHPALVPVAAGGCWPRSTRTRTLRHGLPRCKTLPEALRDERQGLAALNTRPHHRLWRCRHIHPPGIPVPVPGRGMSPASSSRTWCGGSPRPVPAARQAPPAAAPPAEAIRRLRAAAVSRKNSARAARAGQAQRGGATLPLPPPALRRLPRDGDGWAGAGVTGWDGASLDLSSRPQECGNASIFRPAAPQHSFVSGPRADPSDALCLCGVRGPPGTATIAQPCWQHRDHQRQPLPGGGTWGPGWGLVQPEAAAPQPCGGCSGDLTRRDASRAIGT